MLVIPHSFLMDATITTFYLKTVLLVAHINRFLTITASPFSMALRKMIDSVFIFNTYCKRFCVVLVYERIVCRKWKVGNELVLDQITKA